MSATEKESSERAHAVRSMFDRFVLQHDVILSEARPGADCATASFASVTGREEDLVAQQARLADLTVVPASGRGRGRVVVRCAARRAVRFRTPGADLAADGADHDRRAHVPGLERHRRIRIGGICRAALAATRRGGAHPVGRRLPAARAGGARSRRLPGAARGARRHRDVPARSATRWAPACWRRHATSAATCWRWAPIRTPACASSSWAGSPGTCWSMPTCR